MTGRSVAVLTVCDDVRVLAAARECVWASRASRSPGARVFAGRARAVAARARQGAGAQLPGGLRLGVAHVEQRAHVELGSGRRSGEDGEGGD